MPRRNIPSRLKETRSDTKKRKKVLVVVVVDDEKNLQMWFLGLFLGEKRSAVNGETETKGKIGDEIVVKNGFLMILALAIEAFCMSSL